MKVDAKVMFSTYSPWKLFFKVAIPGMVSMFAMSVYIIIEGVFVGHLLGEIAFAAINIAMPVVLINFSIAELVGVGSSVPMSIALGKKDEEGANNIFTIAIVLIFGAAIVMGLLMFFLAEPLSKLMGASGELLNVSAKFIKTYALFGFVTTIFYAMDNFLRVSGLVKTSMVINLILNGISIVLLALLLVVFKMDVLGSVIAYNISLIICVALCFLPFLRGKALLKIVKPKFSKVVIKEIVACGSPAFLSNISGRISSIIINATLIIVGGKVLGINGGVTAVAVYSVLMYSSEIFRPLIYGMSDSISPAIGFNWGARNYDRVKKIFRCGLIGVFVVGIVATVVMGVFSNALTKLFVDGSDGNLYSISSYALKLFSITYLVSWVSIASQSFLAAIEKPHLAIFISLGISFVFPLIVLGSLWNLGLDGIWLNMFGSSILGLALSVFLIKYVFKKITQK